MNKVSIRFLGYDKYAIKYLRRKDIDILNISYSETGNIYTIYESDLDKLDIDSIEIVSYKGMKKILQSIFRNRHFILSIAISIFMMIAISNLVVNVEVIHSNKDIRVLVEDELYDCGVKPFILKKSFRQLQEIKESIRSEHQSDIEWLEIEDAGMKYVVRVEERIITTPEPEPEYCNIVSTKDAVVLSAVPQKGQSMVLSNDFVKKDSVLISGKIVYNEETKSHVCADGVVYGNTWYRVSISIPFEHSTKNYTGKKKNNLGFEFGSTYNRVFKVHFEDYDVRKKRLFGIGKFALYKEVIEEYDEENKVYTEEEALEVAMKEGREKLLVKLGSQSEILSEKVLQSETYDSIINVEIFYSVKEIISEKREASIDEEITEEKPE